MRIATYCRCSTQEQSSEGTSLQAQATALELQAQARGWEIVARFQDVASGKSMSGRPGIAAAIEYVESGQADGIVSARLDRMSRSVVDASQLMERAQKRGWHLIACDVGLDSSTPAGQLVWHVLAAVASWERATIAERTRLGLAEKRAAGVKLGAPRKIQPETIERVRAVHSACGSLVETARRLNAESVKTPTGRGHWQPASVWRVLRLESA